MSGREVDAYRGAMKIPPRPRRALTRLTRDVSFLALGAPLHLLIGVVLFMAFGLVWETVAGQDDSAPVALGFVLLLAAALVPVLTSAQRWRFRRLLGIDVPHPGWRRPWRQLGYHCLAGALIGGLEALVAGLLVAGLAAALAPAWVNALPRQWWLEDLGQGTQAAYVSVAGLVALAAVPASAAALVRLES